MIRHRIWLGIDLTHLALPVSIDWGSSPDMDDGFTLSFFIFFIMYEWATA